MHGLDPLTVGILFWPEVVTGIVGALVVGAVLRTRWVLALPLAGMLARMAAALLLTDVTPQTPRVEILGISALLGMGASLTVTPGMLMAALSVAPALVGRAIALVQLLRLSSAYLVAPVLVHFAMVYAPGDLMVGLQAMFWVVFWMLIGGIAVITLIYVLSGASLQPPGLNAFLERGDPALDSPPITQRRRSRRRGSK